MKFGAFEIAILSAAREKDTERMKDIVEISERNKKIVEGKIDVVMSKAGFETKEEFKNLSTEYSNIERILRLASVYGGS